MKQNMNLLSEVQVWSSQGDRTQCTQRIPGLGIPTQLTGPKATSSERPAHVIAPTTGSGKGLLSSLESGHSCRNGSMLQPQHGKEKDTGQLTAAQMGRCSACSDGKTMQPGGRRRLKTVPGCAVCSTAPEERREDSLNQWPGILFSCHTYLSPHHKEENVYLFSLFNYL